MSEEIKIENEGGKIIVHFGESLDAFSISPVEERVLELLEEGPSVVAFDLGRLREIDSSSIGTFVTLNRTASSRGIKVVIYDVNEPIKVILDMVNISRFIPILTMEEFKKKYG